MCVPTPTRIRSSAKGAQKTMSSANRIRTRLSRKAALAIVGGLIACVALMGWASGSPANWGGGGGGGRARRTRLSRKAALAIVGGLIACVALMGWASGSSAYGQASALGAPPPEWAANAGAWPAHNYHLSHKRGATPRAHKP